MASPITDPDALDIAGVRVGSGIDLCISPAGPIDDSVVTLDRLRTKLRGYLSAAISPGLWNHFADATPGPVRIILYYDGVMGDAASALLQAFSGEAASAGVEVLAMKRPTPSLSV